MIRPSRTLASGWSAARRSWAGCGAPLRPLGAPALQLSPPAPGRGGRAQPAAGGRAFGAGAAEKEPEYASGDLTGYSVFHSKEPFKLRNGGSLPELKIAYETWGELNANRDNAILLQCGMSASSHAASHPKNKTKGWWEDFIGPGRTLDTNLFFVICTNNLGGCYGSSGPSSPHPEDGKPYGSRFPRFEVFDQVAAQFKLMDFLGIGKLHACVGSSLGGMQSVCAAGHFPDRLNKFVSISACAKSFPGSISFRHSQRQAIVSDPNWNGGDYYDGALPEAGLRLARQIGTITYRSGHEWQQRFGQRRVDGVTVDGMTVSDDHGLRHEFEIEKYLDHQGKKWVNNYDPNSMLWISKAMDGFSMEAPDKDGNMSLKAGLAQAMHPALVIGVQHDVLFPVWQQKEIADSLKAAGNRSVVYYELDTVYGHDSFLLDAVSIGPAVKGHLEQEPLGAAHLWQDMAKASTRMLQACLTHRAKADLLRDLFRAVAEGAEYADASRLKRAVKLTYGHQVSEDRVEQVFREKLPPSEIKLAEFLEIREQLAGDVGRSDTYSI